MQKTITVRGKTYTGKQVAQKFDQANMTNGEDYIVDINGDKYFANYRQIQDDYFAPVCSKCNANAIALCPDNGSYSFDIWLTL